MATAPLSMVYRSDKQSQQLRQVLHDFLRNGEFCDIKLLVGACQIQAHRVILAAFSPYFYQVLQQNVTVLTLHNFDERAVRCVIEFCYTGTITVDSVSAEKLLPLANTLQIPEVEKLCRTFLTAQQTLTSEMSPGRRHNYSPGHRSRDDSDTVQVESSGRFSPRNSPNVSTSGRPSSEAGSTEGDAVTIKVETPDEILTDHFMSFRKSTYHETRVADQKPALIDMPQMSPRSAFRPQVFSRPPPQLQLISPRKDLVSALTDHGPTSGLPLLSPRKVSSGINNESSPQLLLMSPQKGVSCNSTPLLKVPLQKESVAVEESEPIVSLPLVSIHQSSQDSIGQSHNAVNLSLQPLSSHDKKESPPLSMAMCNICCQIFNNSELLKSHMAIHGQTHAKRLSKHFKISSETSRSLLPCGTCGKMFKDPQALKFHRYNHILRFPCNMCGRRFSRSWNLHRHKKTHYKSGEFNFSNEHTEENTSTNTIQVMSTSADLTDIETVEGNKIIEDDQKEKVIDETDVAQLLSGTD